MGVVLARRVFAQQHPRGQIARGQRAAHDPVAVRADRRTDGNRGHATRPLRRQPSVCPINGAGREEIDLSGEIGVGEERGRGARRSIQRAIEHGTARTELAILGIQTRRLAVPQDRSRQMPQPPRSLCMRMIGRRGRCDLFDDGEGSGEARGQDRPLDRANALPEQDDVAFQLRARLHAHRLAVRRDIPFPRRAKDVVTRGHREREVSLTITSRQRHGRAHREHADAGDTTPHVVADDTMDASGTIGCVHRKRIDRPAGLRLGRDVIDCENRDGNRDEHRQVPGHTPSLSCAGGRAEGIVAQNRLKGSGLKGSRLKGQKAGGPNGGGCYHARRQRRSGEDSQPRCARDSRFARQSDG